MLLFFTILLIVEIKVKVDHIVIGIKVDHTIRCDRASHARVFLVLLLRRCLLLKMRFHCLLELRGRELVFLEDLFDEHEVFDMLCVH